MIPRGRKSDGEEADEEREKERKRERDEEKSRQAVSRKNNQHDHQLKGVKFNCSSRKRLAVVTK